MHSSYARNNYDQVLIAAVTAYRPVVCVELGVLEGFSTIAIARGLFENASLRGVHGKLHAFDLFEAYEFRHSTQQAVQENLNKAGIAEYVDLQQGDAFVVQSRFQDDSVDFLHVDVSNTGDIVRNILQAWHPKIRMGGVICFEGGSEERDEIEWMQTYNGTSIKKEIETNPIIAKHYVYGTYLRFPSMTVCLRKR